MHYLSYNSILDKVPVYAGLEKNTLTIRLEGNIRERCPSDRHRYDASFPVEVGSCTVDFTSYAPKYSYELVIKSVHKTCMVITFGGNDYIIHEGINFLFDERQYQASYDGPWFTGVDVWQAIWLT